MANSADLRRLTTMIVAAYASYNTIAIDRSAELITDVYQTLVSLAAASARQQPAVDPSQSVFPDYIICLEDGRKLKTLKRHLHQRYGLSPADYRARWKLPADYPMVAPNYTKTQSMLYRKRH